MHSTQHARPAQSSRTNGIKGSIRVPGDKSISHRSLMLSSQVLGTSTISGLLEGADVLATYKALTECGVAIEKDGSGQWKVQGVGIGGLREPENVLDMGNAGTGARLMMGLLAPYPFTSLFTGDASLRSRPMKRVIEPLSLIGARFTSRSENRLPLAMQGASRPMPIEYTLPMASAQVKSAILLSGLNTPGITTVIEKEKTRDHTERMLNYLGIKVEVEDRSDGRHVSLLGQQEAPAANRSITVPADPSSAAFPMVAALITETSDILLQEVCINPLRTGVIQTLQEMGGLIEMTNERELCGEPVADIRVRSSKLKSVTVPAERAPSMIDEYPILAMAAAMAEGDTVMHGLKELRVKESDRLQSIIDGLASCGVKTTLEGDTLTVHGTAGKVAGGGTITTHYDHRIAMCFLVLGMASKNIISVDDTSAVVTSFPGFASLMNEAGAAIEMTGRRAEKTIIAGLGQRAPRRVIAIDGPAASGKGTLARRLADHYGYAYLDTGSLYRAVGLRLVYADEDPSNKSAAVAAARRINDQDLSNPRLRQERVGQAASIVSAIPEVRAILLDYQQQFAERPEGAVLDGRDIGTIVCPNADIKIFMTASMEARAKRRHRELQGEGIEVIYDSVLKELKERDERDSARNAAPLKPAPDAVHIDTTNISAEDVFAHAIQAIEEKSMQSILSERAG
ncbi:MAG: 3-phosphoshikimate 1-carboxyvinyltransferase [Rickettsiales bacterium]